MGGIPDSLGGEPIRCTWLDEARSFGVDVAVTLAAQGLMFSWDDWRAFFDFQFARRAGHFPFTWQCEWEEWVETYPNSPLYEARHPWWWADIGHLPWVKGAGVPRDALSLSGSFWIPSPKQVGRRYLMDQIVADQVRIRGPWRGN